MSHTLLTFGRQRRTCSRRRTAPLADPLNPFPAKAQRSAQAGRGTLVLLLQHRLSANPKIPDIIPMRGRGRRRRWCADIRRRQRPPLFQVPRRRDQHDSLYFYCFASDLVLIFGLPFYTYFLFVSDFVVTLCGSLIMVCTTCSEITCHATLCYETTTALPALRGETSD